MIGSGAVPVVRLTEVFRQAARSRIVTSAHGINRGVIPDLSPPDGDSDFYFVQAADPETAAVRIVDRVKTRIPRRFGFDIVRDIQVLCPMNRGSAGARALNIELQAALNPARERKVERFGWTFAPGDKVMQIVNDYGKDVYNGDTGQVADVDPDTAELTARFHGQEHVYGFGEPGRADAGLCRDGAQEPGLGVSGRGHPDAHPALRDAAAEPALHRSDSRQAPGGARRPEEGHRHRGPQRRRTQAMVQAGRMVAEPCRPEAPARRRSTAWPALKSCRSPNRELARTEGDHMPRALTEHDATALKLTLFARLDRYSTFDRRDLDEMNSKMPTPSGSTHQIMDAINRVRIDGKPVVQTRRTTRKGKTFYELDYPLAVK